MPDFLCISPVDGREYIRRPSSPDEEIEARFLAARAAQRGWADTPLAERSVAVSRFVDAMLAMADDIVPELAWQMGRPVAQGMGEMRGFEERARHMIAIAETALQPVNPGPKRGFKRYIQRVPKGVVLVISPWNFPYMTAVNAVVPALMAGNTVVLKHARQTLGVGDRFAKAAEAAGLPDGVFAHVPMTHAQGMAAIQGCLADHVCFTGSVDAGGRIEEAAAGCFIGVGLELGGKDPAYVREDADLAFTATNIADGAFFNAGQSCCAVERLYVHESVHDEMVERLVAEAEALRLGDPLDEETTLGPMISAEAADFVRGQVDDAVAAGGARRVDESLFERAAPGTPYCAPQIVTGATHDMSLMRDESFGPVLGVMKVGDDREAIRLMNDSDFGLTASIWTRDLGVAERLGTRLQTGTVYVNRCDYLDPALAWTGVKRTGRGVTLSSLGYEALTRPLSFHIRMPE